jgi:hypothetical protein
MEQLDTIVAAEIEISAMVKEANADGVIKPDEVAAIVPKVVQYLKLNPNHSQIQQLYIDMCSRVRSTVSQADELLTQGKAKEGLNLLLPFKNIIPAKDTGAASEYKKLLVRLERIVEAETELLAKVKEANADKVIDSHETIELLTKTIDYLKANPKHVAINKLRDDLIARLPNVPNEVLTKFSPEVLACLPSSVSNRVSPILTNSIGMKLKLLYPGQFVRKELFESYQVTLTKPFYLGVYQVTQEQYERVMGTNPTSFKGARNPVERVSWQDAVRFCVTLSNLPEEKKAGRFYGLPTEAWWEYACRAGTTTKYCFGDNESKLGEYAWYDKNSGSKTHPVGEKKPNAWGLYDMHGNVEEWCSDWRGDYPKGASTDPKGPDTGSKRVLRGGGFDSDSGFCESARRYNFEPSFKGYSFGFRVSMGIRVALDPVSVAE